MKYIWFSWIPVLVVLTAITLNQAAKWAGITSLSEYLHVHLPKSVTERPQIGLSLLFNGSEADVEYGHHFHYMLIFLTF